MFREVRRIRQALPAEESLAVLEKAKRGVLSVTDGEWPYGMPLNHYYCREDGKIYFHCGFGGHREEILKQNPRVSYCVMAEGKKMEGDWALQFESVIVFGTVSFVEDHEKVLEISRRLSRKFTEDEAYIEEEVRNSGARTNMFAITIEHMTGKRVNEK